MKDMEGPCRDMGTNFCVWSPNSMEASFLALTKTTTKSIQTISLCEHHIEVVSSTTSAQREIEGTEKLTDVTSDAGELADT